jgi:hypothetical protein
MFLVNANYIEIDGFEIFGSGNAAQAGSGIELFSGGHDVTLTRNHIHDIGRLCTDTTNGQTAIFVEQPRVTITRNVIHDIGRFAPGEQDCSPSQAYYRNHDHGVYVDGRQTPGADDIVIANNLFYNHRRGWAIQVYPGQVRGLSILNNTFAAANPYSPGQILLGASTRDARIVNNVFVDPRSAGVDRPERHPRCAVAAARETDDRTRRVRRARRVLAGSGVNAVVHENRIARADDIRGPLNGPERLAAGAGIVIVPGRRDVERLSLLRHVARPGRLPLTTVAAQRCGNRRPHHREHEPCTHRRHGSTREAGGAPLCLWLATTWRIADPSSRGVWSSLPRWSSVGRSQGTTRARVTASIASLRTASGRPASERSAIRSSGRRFTMT